MKPASSARQPAPLPLRVLHGLVFAGFTAMCLAVGSPELLHLFHTQLQPFHPGPPPRLELLLPMLAALVGMVAILVQNVRGRGARLSWSLLILGALVLTLWGQRDGLVAGRTADSANLKILQVARELHEGTVNALRTQASVSEDVGTWQTALDKLSQGEPSPVRTRSFAPLPFRIRKIESPEALPPDAPPGTLLLYVMPGGVAYALHPVGVSPTGEPWPLRAPDGEALVFRGAATP